MTFRSSISEAQENTLNGYVQGFLNGMEKKMRKSLFKFNNDLIVKTMLRTANPTLLEATKTRIAALLVEKDGHPAFWKEYALEKESDRVYVFYAPNKDEMLGISGYTKFMPDLGKDDQVLTFLNKVVKEGMKIEDGEFKITIEKPKVEANV
jgi:hypothetical protein